MLSESFAPAAGISGTAAYQFDNSVAGGLGLRTMVTLGGGLSGSEAAAYGTFARLGSFSTSGKLTGALGTPVNQAFDATGEVTARQPGTGTDTMTWDALGRLVGVSRRSRGNSGFNWTAVYDGLGRRLQTSQQTVAGGTATGTAFALKSSYDPDVEFMELAVTAGTQRYWLVHGPDINGRYGALQGTGGIEAVYNASTGATTGVVSDTYGHAEATVNSNNIVTWNTVASNGYGVAPGSLAAVPMDAGHDLSAVLAWRGHYIDCTGYYYLGARYYAPDSGTFLSCDPLGHAASMSLYDYCNGDPVNGIDPDGRCSNNSSSYSSLNGGYPGSGFPDFVTSKLSTMAPMVQNWYGGSNDVGQVATLKFIGEEYSTSTGGKGAWDIIQDANAATGIGGVDFGFRDANTHLPTLGIPESWRTGNGLEKAITQLDYLYHDVGPANINIKSAALMSGITSPSDINALGKYLTTDVGTVDYSVRFVSQAQNDLAPLIGGMSDRTQSQIIVDYMRQGVDKFWSRVQDARGLNSSQLNAWKQAPNTYKGPGGTVPAPLQPNPTYFIRSQYNQIESILRNAR